MSRRVLAWDRAAALLLGLVLLGFGVAVVLWGAGRLPGIWAGSPDPLSTTGAQELYAAGWWRAASLAVGAVLTLLGLWWLLAHLPHTRVGALRLPGSGPAGRLSLDGGSAVSVAAEVLAESPGVRGASGRLRRSRGQVVAEMSVTTGPGTDLGALSQRIDAVTADLAQVMGRDDVRARVRVRVARRDQQAPRVH